MDTVRIATFGAHIFARLNATVPLQHGTRETVHSQLMLQMRHFAHTPLENVSGWAFKAKGVRQAGLFAPELERAINVLGNYQCERLAQPEEKIIQGKIVYGVPDRTDDDMRTVVQLISELEGVREVSFDWPYLTVQLTNPLTGGLVSTEMHQDNGLERGPLVLVALALHIAEGERLAWGQ